MAKRQAASKAKRKPRRAYLWVARQRCSSSIHNRYVVGFNKPVLATGANPPRFVCWLGDYLFCAKKFTIITGLYLRPGAKPRRAFMTRWRWAKEKTR